MYNMASFTLTLIVDILIQCIDDLNASFLLTSGEACFVSLFSSRRGIHLSDKTLKWFTVLC